MEERKGREGRNREGREREGVTCGEGCFVALSGMDAQIAVMRLLFGTRS